MISSFKPFCVKPQRFCLLFQTKTFSDHRQFYGHTKATDIRRKEWLEEATVYVHWPFCKKKCSYCNFNKYVRHSIDHKRMKECLVKEITTLIDLTPVKRIKSIFFGGGTPSLAEPATIQAVIDTVREQSELDPESEITLEANPTSTGTSRLRDFKEAGVNRVSLGIQGLNDQDLQQFGRDHSVDEGLRCLESCKKLFPGRTSIDVMFGRPNQTTEAWREELKRVLEVCDDHLSLYQLTLERGTALFKQVLDRQVVLPGQDTIADMFQETVQVMTDHGFKRYEVSNFAKNVPAESVHNKEYWRGSQYIGVGPGAHGRFVRHTDHTDRRRDARVQVLVPETWMELVEKSGHGTQKVTTQSQTEVLQEILMLALRTAPGLTRQQWEIFTDLDLLQVFAPAYIVRLLCQEGYLHLDETCLRATPKGLNVVDGITSELLNVLNSHVLYTT